MYPTVSDLTKLEWKRFFDQRFVNILFSNHPIEIQEIIEEAKDVYQDFNPNNITINVPSYGNIPLMTFFFRTENIKLHFNWSENSIFLMSTPYYAEF